MTQIFIVVGVLVLAFALRTFQSNFLRKIGAMGILIASFLAAYFPTGSISAGVGGMLFWFLLPWIELLTRIRKMRLPVEKALEKQTPPGLNRFPNLSEFTDQIEKQGFEYVCDVGWDWNEVNQFFRVFYLAEEKTEAAICFTEQDAVSWAYVSITTRHKDGRCFRTSNLPFSNPMKMAPEVVMRRLPGVESFERLLESHSDWIESLKLESDEIERLEPEEIPDRIEKETVDQVKHNLDSGLIALAETAETFRYSWRGLFFLYFQLVKDMVRMC